MRAREHGSRIYQASVRTASATAQNLRRMVIPATPIQVRAGRRRCSRWRCRMLHPDLQPAADRMGAKPHKWRAGMKSMCLRRSGVILLCMKL